MTLWQGILLGLVQGLTEFLPVSSDGHLAVIGHVAGVHTPGVFVEVALHVATLGSILVVYGRRFWQLAVGVFRRQPDALRYAGLLIIGMIPAGLVGVFLEHLIERAFDSLWAAGIGFLVTGALLWSTRHRSLPSEGAAQPTPAGALIIGLAQALALQPGVSRSGITITAARALRMTRESAARFSFLLSLPVIAGAGLFKGAGVIKEGGLPPGFAAPFFWGFVAAAVSGYVVIWWLLAYLRRRSFALFMWYRLAVAALVFTLVATGLRPSMI